MSPWPDLLRLGVLRLGLTPEAFWRLSLAEWRILTLPEPGADQPLTRNDFEALTALYPDDPHVPVS
jgi:uncharacterized phage protein (TIGR02216 family)